DGLTPAQILAAAQSFGFTTVQQLGFDNLFEVVPGASVTLAGPLVKGNNSVVFAGNSVLNIAGALTGMGTSGLIDLHPSASSAVGNFVSVELVASHAGQVTLGGSLCNVAGGSVLRMAGGSLLSLANGSTTSILDGAFLVVSGGSVFQSTSGPLATFAAGRNTLALQNAPLCST